MLCATPPLTAIKYSYSHSENIDCLSTFRSRPLWDHTNRNDLESRRDTRRRLQTDSNEHVIRNRKPRTQHQNLRCPSTARQLSTRHRTNRRIRRGFSIRHIFKVQQLHGLSVIRIRDQPILIHDQVASCVEGQNNGLGARGAIEADEGAVSVVELGVGAV